MTKLMCDHTQSSEYRLSVTETTIGQDMSSTSLPEPRYKLGVAEVDLMGLTSARHESIERLMSKSFISYALCLSTEHFIATYSTTDLDMRAKQWRFDTQNDGVPVKIRWQRT